MMQKKLDRNKFRTIRESDGPYVDKTRMIDSLVADGSFFLAFSRPDGFGKSMNLSMLDCYFNEKYGGNGWFDGLAVSELRPDDPLKNSLPVLSFSLGDLDTRTYDGFLEDFGRMISDAASDSGWFTGDEELPIGLRRDLEEIFGGYADHIVLIDSVRVLTETAFKTTGKRPLVLVDDYDSPLNSVMDENVRRDIAEFLQTFMSSAFKGNPYICKGVIAGTLPHAGLFVRANNVSVECVSTGRYPDAFGFTPAEAGRIASYMGGPDMQKTLEEWYGGYRVGDTELLCPGSVMSCIGNGFRPDVYRPVPEVEGHILRKVRENENDLVESILSGKEMACMMKTWAEPFDEDPAESDLISLMAAAGYLRVEETQDLYFLMSVPNREARLILERELGNRIAPRAWLPVPPPRPFPR